MTAVFGIVKDQEHAAAAVDRFQDEGFGRGEISIIAPELPDEDAVEANEVHASTVTQGTLTGTVAGAIVGGALGWFTGWGGLAFPGVGPLIAAGPWLMGLGGAIFGGAVGCITAGLMSLVMFRNHAEQVEHGLQSGQVLVGVQTHNDEEIRTARKVFATLDASEVTTDGNPADRSEDIETKLMERTR